MYTHPGHIGPPADGKPNCTERMRCSISGSINSAATGPRTGFRTTSSTLSDCARYYILRYSVSLKCYSAAWTNFPNYKTANKCYKTQLWCVTCFGIMNEWLHQQAENTSTTQKQTPRYTCYSNNYSRCFYTRSLDMSKMSWSIALIAFMELMLFSLTCTDWIFYAGHIPHFSKTGVVYVRPPEVCLTFTLYMHADQWYFRSTSTDLACTFQTQFSLNLSVLMCHVVRKHAVVKQCSFSWAYWWFCLVL